MDRDSVRCWVHCSEYLTSTCTSDYD